MRQEWIRRAITGPEAELVQADGRIRRWARIPEAAGKYLRVVLLDDGKAVQLAATG